MAEVMSQQGFGLSVPTSRQDIISQLLNDYGNSFGRGDVSSSAYSPVAVDKELPPPPPQSDSLDKPLPAVQRAEQRMSTKFQLRVIEDAPLSPNSISKYPSGARARRKIPFRSLSRDGKPPSLSLVTSNGSTAIVPPTPALSARSQTFPMPSSFDTKALPSPPPPPPEKSERRSRIQKATPTLKQSKSQSDLARNDSLISQDENRPTPMERPATVEATTVVKRKAVPAPAAKKFMGLAQLGTGPRGGKGGPLPPTSAPRKKSVDAGTDEVKMPVQEAEPEARLSKQHEGPTVNHMPPTPEDDKFSATAPAPPRKVFPALGLPSNPRAKGGPISPKHVRGKSSTGFNLLKAQRPAPPVPTKIVETLTPEMTPSPTLKAAEPREQAISPLSPLPPPTDQRRPFSFEPIAAPKPSPRPQEQPKTAVPIITPVVTVPPMEDINTPLRPTSADLPDLPEPSPLHSPPTAATLAVKAVSPIAASAAPAPPKKQPSPPAIVPRAEIVQEDERVSTPPPFAPLTRAPIPLPQDLIPAIASPHLTCYTSHQTAIWSNNTFQPMGCMVCRTNDRDRKWCCTWCQLRICRSCSEELKMVPGQSLSLYLRIREEQVDREKVLSAVYEKDEDFS
ncbi:hypothetical protein DE146DRAFT_431961 [Phaeosphaeria sp. MPI-PUGE-AT-0046c]|nr:hypothetical protein DE146DRAFT_431961 [Phaeosphaeria sp. MPI-PUGE-AT-0046c]